MSKSLLVLPPRTKRADLIVEEIKRRITAEGLQPGDRLPKENELCQLLNSSRWTVREALKVLESQGLIEIGRGADGGARISHVPYGKASVALRSHLYFEPITCSQVYRVRQQLEPILALEVVGLLTAQDFDALQQSIEACELGIEDKIEPREHRIAELEFHAVLARACPDPFLRFQCCFITDLLRDLTFSDRTIFPTRETRFGTAALRFHRGLLAAYQALDRSKVQELMTAHLCDAGCIVAEREAQFDRSVLLKPEIEDRQHRARTES